MKGLSLMSVPNFRKSYHTVLGAAIDSHGTNIIRRKPTNIAASGDADSSKDCETRRKCIFFTILERRVKEGKKSEEGKEEKKEVSCSRTLRQGIELATFWLLNDFSTSCTTVAH